MISGQKQYRDLNTEFGSILLGNAQYALPTQDLDANFTRTFEHLLYFNRQIDLLISGNRQPAGK